MKPIRTRLAAAILLACLAPAPAAAQEAASQPALRLDYRQITLDNGLKVITLEDFSCPIVCVEVWYHVGSKNERPDRQGFAHMFEHMMFRGTDRLGPTEHFDLIRRVGGSCGGSTGFDRTVYVEVLPADQLELALWLEAERMAFLKVDQESFDTERKVVEEERRMGLNRPYGSLFEKGLAELYKAHPYRWPPIGRIDHLRAAAVQELRDFWELYYSPNNAALIVTGAVRHADAQALARRYFGWIPRGRDVPKVDVREPLPTEGRSVTIGQANAPAPLVAMAFRSPPRKDPNSTAMDMLVHILGVGNSSRVYRELVAERRLAVGVSAYNYSMEQDGLFHVGAGLPPVGADPAAATAALAAQVARLRDEPVSDAELTKARNQLLRDAVAQSLHISDKAGMLAGAAVLEGDVARVNLRLQEMRRLTAEDLQRAARRWLDANRALTISVPQNLTGVLAARFAGLLGAREVGEEDAPVTAAPEKLPPPPGRPGAKRPDGYPASPPLAPVRARPFEVPQRRLTLDNGLTVIVIPNHEVPLVAVKLGLLAGAWADEETPGKPGTAHLTLGMLTKETAGRSEAQIAEQAETYAIWLGGQAHSDYSEVNASCLSEHLDRAMELLADVVRRPSFPPEEFAKLQAQVLAGLRISQANPGYIADRALDRLVFGSHPYSRPATGEANDVAALEVADLRQWWGRFARPDQAALILAGDVTADRAAELVRRHLGDWRATGPAPRVELPAPPDPAATRIVLIDQPGSIQAEIRLGQLSFPRRDGRHFRAAVVDGYFGRGFGSRLNRTVRVDKGLTYGIVGLHHGMRFAGRFFVGTFSKTASTGAALKAILAEIDRLRAEGPDQRELADVKSYVMGGFPGRRETPMQLAADLWMIQREGLGEDWFDRMLQAVSSATAEQCLELARSSVDPSKLAIVVVGDAAKLADELGAIAPVTVVRAQPATATAPAAPDGLGSP